MDCFHLKMEREEETTISDHIFAGSVNHIWEPRYVDSDLL